jgi:hypothetical protein
MSERTCVETQTNLKTIIKEKIMKKVNNRLIVKTLNIASSKGFSVLAGINRPITPAHVTKLASSLEKMGVVRPVVVANIDFVSGTPTNYIIDGQHLYHALMRMGWDIPYKEIEIKDAVDLAEHLAFLNASSKSWTMKDYITVWANVNKDYVKLNKYFNTYDIELNQLADILMNNSCSAHSGGNWIISRIIKRGEFTIDDEKRAVYLLNCVTDSLKIIPRMDRQSNKLFIASFVNFINTSHSYNHAVFMKNLKNHREKFKLSTQDPEEFKKLLKSIL